ncbi:unnamed protein product, partial [marine sediment metagenome]
PLISHIEERLDDLVKVKGTLLSPFSVDAALYSFKDIKNYLFIIDEENGIDVVRVYIEGDKLNEIDIKKTLKAITFITPKSIKIIPKDKIPLIGRKGKRFVDLRKNASYNNIVRNFERAHLNT